MDKPLPSSPVLTQTKKKSLLNKAHFGYKHREYFSENLALLLKAGVPVDQALASLANAVSNKQLRATLSGMQADIQSGSNLADALERSGLVGGQTLALVRLGETSGHLVENLQVAAKQEEKRHVFASKIRSALIYPTFVLSLTLIIGIGVAWFLLPRLAETFSKLQIQLPLMSRVLLGLGTFLKEHGVVAVPLFFTVIVVLIYVLFLSKPTKHIGQRILFALPGVGRLMSEVEMAQFGYLLGTLLNAGLGVTETLKLLAGASTSIRHRKFYGYLAQSLADGYSFQDSIKRYPKADKLIPPAIQQMIIAGEHSGSLPEVFLTIGHTYEEKADVTTNNLEAIIEPILLVIMAAGVMLVAMAVIVPIYSLVGGVNK